MCRLLAALVSISIQSTLNELTCSFFLRNRQPWCLQGWLASGGDDGRGTIWDIQPFQESADEE
jgi:hypothetical protein